jgi:hypothetical protein
LKGGGSGVGSDVGSSCAASLGIDGRGVAVLFISTEDVVAVPEGT